MKKFVLIFINLLMFGQAFADCSGEGLWVFPVTKTIKQNSNIVLTGYFRSQNIITSLNKKYPVYLESDGHKVKLVVKSTYIGMFDLTKAVLQPKEKLISGRIYQLKIDNLDEHEKSLLTNWNSNLNNKEPIAWKVEEGSDYKPPRQLYRPKLSDKRNSLYGCGSETYVDFKIPAFDDSEILIVTELVDVESGKSNSYLLSLTDVQTVGVGHGMCSGGFKFKHNGNFKVRFKLMDICGNENKEWTDWLEFDKPKG